MQNHEEAVPTKHTDFVKLCLRVAWFAICSLTLYASSMSLLAALMQIVSDQSLDAVFVRTSVGMLVSVVFIFTVYVLFQAIIGNRMREKTDATEDSN